MTYVHPLLPPFIVSLRSQWIEDPENLVPRRPLISPALHGRLCSRPHEPLLLSFHTPLMIPPKLFAFLAWVPGGEGCGWCQLKPSMRR